MTEERWSGLQSYLAFHHRSLDAFRDWFIVSDDLSYRFDASDRFVIQGRISCRPGLFVDVRERLAVDYRGRARMIKYRYHAGVVGNRPRSVFRYDDAHTYLREQQPDKHHMHRFDHRTWREINPPEWIGEHRRPRLDKVIEELHQWWESTGSRLGLGVVDEQGTP